MNEVTLTTPACLVRLRTTPAEVHAIAERLGLFEKPPASPLWAQGKRKLFQARPVVVPIPVDNLPALSDSQQPCNINPLPQ